MTTPSSEEQNQIPFGLLIQYVKDQSFESPNPVDAFLAASNTQPSIGVDIGASANKVREGFYEVVLNIRTEGLIEENKPLFIAELSYAAIVGVGEEPLTDEQMGDLLMVHYPTLLFPFARSIIANMTRDGGFPALMLTPVDFAALYAEQKKKAA
jgi:preprotein translocase subunit SecB